MTTTELYSGYSAEGKPTSRVLQPPGGDSSNIFGSSEPPAQHQRRQAEKEMMQPPYQTAAGAGEDRPPPQKRHQDGANKQAEAPFASFAESGKKSSPNQFNNCNNESQNLADYRSYSVKDYRNAAETNAAVKQRARGQASGSFNPITHEEDGSQPGDSQFREYEQARVNPGARQTQQRRVAANRDAGKVTYNPITGEEYPADYGQAQGRRN